MKELCTVRVLLLGLLITCFAWPALGSSVSFEFNTPGVLPSAQGATYGGNVAETSVFSVSGGLLHQDTTILPGAFGLYLLPAGTFFDHTLNAELEWSVRLLSATGSGSAVTTILYDAQSLSGNLWNFGIEPDGVLYSDWTVSRVKIVSMDTTDALHTYKVVIAAGNPTFDFLVDNVLVFSGVSVGVPSFPAPDDQFAWGDPTGPIGGSPSAKADWDFVRFTNSPSTIPESSSVVLLLLGLSAGLIKVYR